MVRDSAQRQCGVRGQLVAHISNLSIHPIGRGEGKLTPIYMHTHIHIYRYVLTIPTTPSDES